MHVHCEQLPNRRWNVMELADEATKMGMRAIVLKNLFGQSQDLAHLVNNLRGGGTEMIGMVSLNQYAGGMNARLARDYIRMGAKVISMPNIHAVNDLKRHGWPTDDAVYVYVNNELTPEAKEVLAVIADHGAVLYSGHIAPEESVMLAKDARNLGVKKYVVTHPLNLFTRCSVEQQKEMAASGAYMEHIVGLALTYYHTNFPGHPMPVSPFQVIEEMKAVGFEHCVLSTDCGNGASASPVECLRSYIYSLLDAGLSRESIEEMVKKTPAKLLDLN